MPGRNPGGPPPPNTDGGVADGWTDRVRNMFGGEPAPQTTIPQTTVPMGGQPINLQQLMEIARAQNDMILQLRNELAQARQQANAGEVDRLRQELAEAQRALEELNQRIGKPPLQFGTLIRVTLPATDAAAEQTDTPPETVDLTITGTRVRLLSSHRLFGQVAVTGTVLGLNTNPAGPAGTVNVQMDPTAMAAPQVIPCRFGLPEVDNGISDIEQIDAEAEARLTDPTRFTIGARVRSRTNPNRNGQIADLNNPNYPGRALVVWSDTQAVTDHAYGPGGELELVEQPVVPEREFGRVVVAIGNQMVEVSLPPEIDARPGQTVKINSQMQVVEITDPIGIGPVASINRVLTEGEGGDTEVNYNQQKLVVKIGNLAATVPDAITDPEDRAELMRLRAGDVVVMDASLSTVVKKLPQDDTSYRFAGDTGVDWDDVSGQETAKEELREAVEVPRTHAELYARYNKKPPKGVLFYGPPGCGKTMLGKALATALRNINGNAHGSLPMLSVRGPELLSKWVGETEATIRGLFAQADRWYDRHGYPLIIFIDEADAILRTRGSGVSSDMNDTVVPMFLSLMDGLNESKAIVILATNRPDTLDPAITREGRIDRKVYIPRPTQEVAKAIFARAVAKTAIFNGSTPDQLADAAVAEFWNAHLFRVKRRSGTETTVSLGDIISGAMVVSAVDQATSLAMRREIATGNTDPAQSGITQLDVINGVQAIVAQNRDLDHEPELEEITRPYANDVDRVVRLRQRSNG